MLFTWKYPDITDPEYTPIRMMLGKIEIGNVVPLPDGQWRAICNLPQSGRYGGTYAVTFPYQGVAMSTLEIIGAMWVNDSGLLTN